MNTENFKKLKEIDSLQKKKVKLEILIISSNSRVDHIKDQREKKEEILLTSKEKLKEASLSLSKIENNISTLQRKLDSDKNNLNSLIDEKSIINLQKQINEQLVKLDQLEEEGLNYIENTEELEKQIKDCLSFLDGSKETLAEIQDEVKEETKELNEKLSIINNRILLITNSLPQNFQDRIQLVLSKNLKDSNFTRIKNDACEYCRYGMSKLEVHKIEDDLNLKSCQACSRIFIPIQANY